MSEKLPAEDVVAPAAPVEVKKKPGRPKKKVVITPAEVHGIVNQPVNNDDLVELVYCNPTLFKKLMALYKAYEVSEIEWIFDAAGVKISTKDHLGKSTIYATIDGRCMNLYYCKERIRICVKRDSLDRILGTLGKNNYKITIILKNNYRSTLYIIIKDLEYNNDDSYEVDVVFKPDSGAVAEDDDTNYPIKFKIASRHFKTKINNIRKLSQTFTIQKCGNEPLQFTFDKAQQVNWTGVYNDSDKIELQSALNADEIFSVSIFIDYIKPFSNSNIGDNVYIAADKREKISFMSLLDKKEAGHASCVKIYTEIKDYRREV